jgi:hypothetical protein
MTPRKKKTAAKPAPKQEFKKSADFVTIYANWISVTFTPHDFSLTLGQTNQVNSELVEIEHRGRVLFSPLEGKLLSVILRKIVDSYETQYGKLVIPHVIGDQLVEQMPEIEEMMRPKTEGD